jgi:hypothetical protein
MWEPPPTLRSIVARVRGATSDFIRALSVRIGALEMVVFDFFAQIGRLLRASWSMTAAWFAGLGERTRHGVARVQRDVAAALAQ